MTLIDNLVLGIGLATRFEHLLPLTLGCVLGALSAAMPRLGLLSMMSLALPVAAGLQPIPALILLVGIYCGACGGTAPPADGSVQHRSGEGPALRPVAAAAPLTMLAAALLGALVLVVLAPWTIEFAFRFGPAEYFSMMALGLLALVVLSAGSLMKSLTMLVLGLLLAYLGSDPVTGQPRFAPGYLPLDRGIGFIPLALGLLVVGRIVSDLVTPLPADREAASPPDVAERRSLRRQLRRDGPATARGGAVGSLLGTVPGAGILIGAFVAAAVERRLRGEAAAAHSAAPAAAVLAGTRSSFVPLLALGVPTNAALALVAATMMDKQVPVGPQLMTGRADLFWALLAAVAISGIILFVFGSPLGLLQRQARRLPFAALYPVVGVFACVATYSLQGSTQDVVAMSVFAALGHLFFKFGCPLAPLLVGFIVAPTMEGNLRHALELSAGDWSTLVTRPISAGLLLAGGMLIVALLLPSLRPRRAALSMQAR